MALTNDTLLSNLATDIVDTIAAMDQMTVDPVVSRTRAIAQLKKLLEKIMTYIVSNAEVSLSTSTRTIETYTIGVGSNGGSLSSATGGPVSGSVVDSKAATGTVA